MRRTSLALTAVVAASSLAACSMLTGLDGITENDCAPHGCADGATAEGAASTDGASSGDGAPAADSALADRTNGPDATRSDAGEGDDGGDDHPDAASGDGSAHDAGTGDDGASSDAASSDGAADAVGDAGPDAFTDATPEASTDAAAEASADASTHDASDASAATDADAAPDSGCGTVYLSDAFDTNAHGWTLDSTWAIAPTCASPPAPQKGHPDPTADHTAGAVGGGVVAAFACGNNPSGTTAAARYATSPAVDVSAAPALKLSFWRWLNSDAAGWMTSTVDVFDGSAWVNVYTNPSGAGNIVADASWSRVEYDVTAYKNAAFRVRFGYAINSASVYAMSCWNVDDVTLSTASCP
jgi:hypothetical protein